MASAKNVSSPTTSANRMATPGAAAVLDHTRDPFHPAFHPGPPHTELLRQVAHNAHANAIKMGPSEAFHNHAAALLTAMWRLGATTEEIAAVLDTTGELSSLRPAKEMMAAAPSLTITTDNWREHLGGFGLFGLGSDRTFPAYLQFFNTEIQTHGAPNTVRTYFPHLAAGAMGDFFHALIELGYHYESRSPDLVGVGLAWIAASYVKLPRAPDAPAPVFTSAVEALAALSTDTSLVFPTYNLHDGSSGYIAAVEELATEHAVAVQQYDLVPIMGASADVRAARMRDICAAAVDSFAAGGCTDFYLLHLVTGSRAAWAILNGAADLPADTEAELLETLWRAVLYTHVARNRPWPPPASPSSPSASSSTSSQCRPWPDIVSAGRTSGNSHIAKVIFTCADFHDKWGDSRFYHTANGVIAARDAGEKLVGTGVGSQMERFLSRQR
eukprot:m.173605 g.173605  ORF g.173605 m.173605 type:complete len:442 (+) comp13717_c0_seq1:249-1574(+)